MAHPLYASDYDIRMWLGTIRLPEWLPQTGRLTDAVASFPPSYVTLLHTVALSRSQELPDSLSKNCKGRGAESHVSDDEN